jgi:hypothetical protein
MRRPLIFLAALTGLMALSCSRVPGIPRFNMDYSTEVAGLPQYIYVFNATAVNVFVQGVPVGDGTTVTNATSPYDHVIRIPILENAPYKIEFDEKRPGHAGGAITTLTIDWSKHKPNYFPLTAAPGNIPPNGGTATNITESFNIENTGYILRSTIDTNLYLSEQS